MMVTSVSRRERAEHAREVYELRLTGDKPTFRIFRMGGIFTQGLEVSTFVLSKGIPLLLGLDADFWATRASFVLQDHLAEKFEEALDRAIAAESKGGEES